LAKRRFNAKKIANTPSLKKRMAKFCAEMDVKYTKPDYLDILYKGHRGFISYSEDDLAKEFDKKLSILREKYSIMKANDDTSKNGRFYRKSDDFVELELWYEEGVSIANEIFEEQFLV
jgi:hypothetical protein